MRTFTHQTYYSEFLLKKCLPEYLEAIHKKPLDVSSICSLATRYRQLAVLEWHLHEQFGRLQLIQENLYQKTGHIGGMETWINEVTE